MNKSLSQDIYSFTIKVSFSFEKNNLYLFNNNLINIINSTHRRVVNVIKPFLLFLILWGSIRLFCFMRFTTRE